MTALLTGLCVGLFWFSVCILCGADPRVSVTVFVVTAGASGGFLLLVQRGYVRFEVRK